MRVLLVGKSEEAMGIYQRILRDVGIEAYIGDDSTRLDEYEVVLYLWPMRAFLFGAKLRAALEEQKQKEVP